MSRIISVIVLLTLCFSQLWGLPTSKRNPISTSISPHRNLIHKRKLGDRVVFEEDEMIRNKRGNGVEDQQRFQTLIPRKSAFSVNHDSFHHHPQSPQTTSGGLDGKLKQLLPLIQQANPFSISILFAMLIWRLVVTCDMLDQQPSTLFGQLARLCTTSILFINAVGAILTLFRPIAMKNYLKLILAVNIIREWTSTLLNLTYCLVGGQDQRDIHIGRLFMNIWFLTLCYSYRNSRWVAKIIPPKGIHPHGEK